MRKMSLAIVAGVAAIAASVPAVPAQAQPNTVQQTACDTIWINNQNDGNMRAWDGLFCTGTLLGVTPGSDSNWANTTGPFRTTDNDRASSVMNTGTVSGGLNAVRFYLHAAGDPGGRGGITCLQRTELYADDLRDNTFTDGIVVNNNISRHDWTFNSECEGRFVT